MKNPLKLIKDWIAIQDSNERIQYDFYALSYYFFIGYDRDNASDPKAIGEHYMSYLNEELETREVLARAISFKALINFSILGRDTSEGWELSRERTMAVDSRLRETDEKYKPDFIARIMSDFDERKEIWIAWCKQWHELTSQDLSDDRLAEWWGYASHEELKKRQL